jgi:hypothetical protein
MKIQIHKNSLECFIRFGFLAYAIRQRQAQGNWLPELTLGSLAEMLEATRFLMIDKRADNFRNLLKDNWNDRRRSQWHPYWAQRKLLITSIDKAYEIFNAYKNDKDVALTTENVFEVLRLRDGFSMGKKMTHIVRTWETVKGEKNKIYELAQSIVSKMTDEELEPIFSDTTKANVDWIYDPTYDPQKV